MTDHTLRALTDTLENLGIEELKERLEISPLLVGTGSDGTESPDMRDCCTCKTRPDLEDPGGDMWE